MKSKRRKNKYSPSEYVKMIYSWITTKIIMPQCRIVRRPIYIRGKKSISGGNGLSTGRFCRFDLDGMNKTLFIGTNCEFGDNTHIVALNKVIIGDNVLIASKCFISDTSHGEYRGNCADSPLVPPNERQLKKSYVIIGDNVWIGENVVILMGVTIGNGCIIGANSVVTKDVADNTIVAGAPARIIKRWSKEMKAWIKV